MLDARNTFSLIKPDDMHVHLRDGAALAVTVPATASQFARAVVMPNLRPSLTTVDAALAYRERILAAVPPQLDFEPLMTLYLNADLSEETIARAAAHPHIIGVKYYPHGATTHSASGLLQLSDAYTQLGWMEKYGLPLLLHGECMDEGVDIFDREAYFLERSLLPTWKRFPALRMVLEHITTAAAVDCVTALPSHIGATITAHHLAYERSDFLSGGLRPHLYCMPLLKRRRDQEALLRAATSGDAHFFLGTDSAPHPRSQKESACGCAGVYSAPYALPWYAHVFARAGALDRLEDFASRHGAAFYGLPYNQERLTLNRTPMQIPSALPYLEESIVPMGAAETISFSL